jgi:hypothetical protein
VAKFLITSERTFQTNKRLNKINKIVQHQHNKWNKKKPVARKQHVQNAPGIKTQYSSQSNILQKQFVAFFQQDLNQIITHILTSLVCKGDKHTPFASWAKTKVKHHRFKKYYIDCPAIQESTKYMHQITTNLLLNTSTNRHWKFTSLNLAAF